MPNFSRNRPAVKAAMMMRIHLAVEFMHNADNFDQSFRDKEDEATRWFNTPSPNLNLFPFIKSEVGITAATGAEVADAFRQARNQRLVRWGNLNGIVVTARRDIAAATTVAQIGQAFSTARTALLAWAAANVPFAVNRVTDILEGTTQ